MEFFKGVSPIKGCPFLIIDSREKYGVVADLHIGSTIEEEKKGIVFAEIEKRMGREINQICKSREIKRLIILGDVKETIGYPERKELKMLSNFFSNIECDLIICKGNHDGMIEEVLKDISVSATIKKEILIGRFAFFHGHSFPSKEAMRKKTMVMGHYHFLIGTGEKAWVVSKSKGKELVIVPSYSYATGGITIENIKECLLFKRNLFELSNTKVYGPDLKLIKQ
ncbi:MAG: metallophosphoesterase [Candidatus Micrarchaeaceae archaeon]